MSDKRRNAKLRPNLESLDRRDVPAVFGFGNLGGLGGGAFSTFNGVGGGISPFGGANTTFLGATSPFAFNSNVGINRGFGFANTQLGAGAFSTGVNRFAGLGGVNSGLGTFNTVSSPFNLVGTGVTTGLGGFGGNGTFAGNNVIANNGFFGGSAPFGGVPFGTGVVNGGTLGSAFGPTGASIFSAAPTSTPFANIFSATPTSAQFGFTGATPAFGAVSNLSAINSGSSPLATGAGFGGMFF